MPTVIGRCPVGDRAHSTVAEVWRRRLDVTRQALLDRYELGHDGSASPHALAARAAVRSILPAAVDHYGDGTTQAVRLRLGRPFAFNEPPRDNDALAFLREAREERVSSVSEPGGEVIWLAVDDEGACASPLELVLDHSLSLQVDAHVERQTLRLAECLDAIGWRLVVVPTPHGAPDPRFAVVARWSPGTARPQPIEATSLTSDAEALRTLLVVPDVVEDAMQRARVLYVRGWHQWEHLTLAKREATFALEASVTVLDADTRGRKKRNTFADALKNLARVAPPLLSQWERAQAETLRLARNQMTHPSGHQPIEWISWARADIERCCYLINVMWARRRSRLPEDLFWEAAGG